MFQSFLTNEMEVDDCKFTVVDVASNQKHLMEACTKALDYILSESYWLSLPLEIKYGSYGIASRFT